MSKQSRANQYSKDIIIVQNGRGIYSDDEIQHMVHNSRLYRFNTLETNEMNIFHFNDVNYVKYIITDKIMLDKLITRALISHCIFIKVFKRLDHSYIIYIGYKGKEGYYLYV